MEGNVIKFHKPLPVVNLFDGIILVSFAMAGLSLEVYEMPDKRAYLVIHKSFLEEKPQLVIEDTYELLKPKVQEVIMEVFSKS